MPKTLALFEYRFSTPPFRLKKRNNQKTKTGVHTAMSLVSKFSSFSTSKSFVWKPKTIKTHQRASTRDRKWIL